MHVKDIMSRKVFSIDKDQNIYDALKLMKRHKISRLPVTNTNNDNIKELVGIMTKTDIARRLGSSRYGNLAPSHFHVSTVMTSQPLTIESNRSIGKAAQLMVENQIGGVPVMDEGEIIGIITKTDFISTYQGKPFHNITADEWMTPQPITINIQDRLVHARRLIIDEGIGRLPVMEDDELRGILSAKDIAESMISFRKVVPDKYKPARIRNLLVGDIMTQNVISIDENTSIEDIAKMMIDNNFGGLPVVENGSLKGIITKTDLLKLTIDLEEVN